MRLNWVEFENRDINLKIERVYFNNDITLLVGLTGSGKSQIVHAIQILCGIATSSTESFQRVLGAISFTIGKNEYVWEVSTDFPEYGYVEPSREKLIRSNYLHMMYYDTKTIVSFEKLTCNDELLFERDGEKNLIKGFQDIPLVDDTRSFISLYHRNNIFVDIYSCFSSVYQIWNLNHFVNKCSSLLYNKKKAHYTQLIDLLQDKGLEYGEAFPGNEPLVIKIPLLKETNKDLWQNIFLNYQAIFPEVDDIEIEPCSEASDAVTVFFHIDNQKVDIGNISAGMNRILQYIISIQTAFDSNIILIDEMENGLGINCIDSIWDIIKKQSHNAQFIITSHHPYIISNLDYKKLKIVDRKDNVIKTHSGDELGLGDTHLDIYDAVFNKLLFGEKK